MATERDVVHHLDARYAPEAIVLVGSRADGRARPGSDWDLYVLLPPDRAAPRGPVPAPDTLDDELLDVGLVRLPIDAQDIALLFGPNLQQSRVLRDNARGDAARICAEARELYGRGRGLTPAEIARRRHEMARNLARMKARADEPGPFFEALTHLFYTAHRAWYEVLRDRWSASVHRAMEEIARVDPEFHRRLRTLVDGPSPEARIEAAEAIFDALFAGGRADRGCAGLAETLHTERLTLRPFASSDAPAVFDYSRDADWAAYQQAVPRSESEAERAVAELRLRDWETRPVWAITRSGDVVGIVSLVFEANHRIAQIGYGIHRDHRGLGLTAEAVKAVLDAAFSFHPPLVRVAAHSDSRNLRSHRLLEKLGFVREGTLRSGGVNAQGELVDGTIHALLRSEWRGPR